MSFHLFTKGLDSTCGNSRAISRKNTRRVSFHLKELRRLALQHKQCANASDNKNTNQNQPIPPTLVFIDTDIFQHPIAILLSLETTAAFIKLCNRYDANTIGQTAQILGPGKPRWNQFGCYKELRWFKGRRNEGEINVRSELNIVCNKRHNTKV